MATQPSPRPPVALPSTQVARRAEATRAALLSSARRLFVEKGFHATGTEEIVREAGLTRGALYHHFAGKRELFVAVFESVEAELMAAGASGAARGSAFTRLRHGLLGFLDAALVPEVQRILLIDGPAVLGWQRWREIEARHGLQVIGDLLSEAMRDGAITEQPVVPLAHLLLAAVDEAALYIANAPHPAAARDEAVTAMANLLAGLRRRRARQ